MPQIKEKFSNQEKERAQEQKNIALISSFLNSTEKTMKGIEERYNTDNGKKDNDPIAVLSDLALDKEINLDIRTIYCQKTGQPIGERFKSNIDKMQAFLGEDKFKSVAKYLPLSNGYAGHWLFTDRNTLHRLLTEDPKGFYVFAICRVLKHKHKDLELDIEKKAQWENSKARGYMKLVNENISDGKLIAANQVLRHFLSLNPNLFAWPEVLPEEFCTEKQIDNIHETFGKKVLDLMARKRLKTEQDIAAFSDSKEGKGYSDMRIGAGQKIKEESPYEQVLRLIAGLEIKDNPDLYLFKQNIVASEDGISRKAKSILGFKQNIEDEIKAREKKKDKTMFSGKINNNMEKGKRFSWGGKK